jgi:hypothetical protein
MNVMRNGIIRRVDQKAAIPRQRKEQELAAAAGRDIPEPLQAEP